jgi:hypothetical protein
MTRIIDESTIQQGQKDLVGRLVSAINMEALRATLTGLPTRLDQILDIQSTGDGNLVSLHDSVAYRLDLKVTIPLSIMVDAEGNYLPMAPAPPQIEEIACEAAASAEGCHSM